MHKGLRKCCILAGLTLAAHPGTKTLATAQSTTARRAMPPSITKVESRCTCSDGRSLEAGVVSYKQNSDRETISRIEMEMSSHGSRCRALWIGSTEIRPVGTPYQFRLERTALKEQRVYGCDYPTQLFVKRDKTYEFVFDADSQSIREMRPLGPNGLRVPAADPRAESNANLWSSIADNPAGARGNRKGASQIDSTREFNRTSWVLARTRVKAHYVGVVKDPYQGEKLVTLNRTRKVKAGQLGQIEAVSAGRAIVRFYDGSRIEKFAKTRNAIRRWYERVGGPYEETKDDLYTPLRALILEVPLDDIIEVNDYLDQKQTDQT
jgi:hypothetical protein